VREIIFRAKDENNKWAYCDFNNPINIIWCSHNKNILHFTEQIIKNTLGQYTGIKDKNNKKIFEWDIVKAWSSLTNKEQCFIIEFDENRLHFGFRPINSGYIYNIDELLIELGEELYFEIVGNIYDNPKLL
jgi:uncharacterized phage protein (TIGR01671 family)